MEKQKTRLIVLIDPGHGANDHTKGKYSPVVKGMGVENDPTIYNMRFREGNFNRLVGNKLAAKINGCDDGVKAIVIVPEAKDISLNERVQRVNKYCEQYGREKVLLVSVHSNAAGVTNEWTNAKGWLAIVDDYGSAKAQEFADMLYDEVKRQGLKTRQAVSNRKWYYYRECIGKQSRLAMLSKTKCPAVLTENFFYTDADEVRFLASEAGRSQIVDYHYGAIKRYADKYFPIQS